MRLICPNCDAQYEVVDDVIPADGRDVQCSNCGQTWFQHHPDHMPPADAVDETADPRSHEGDVPAADEERTQPPSEPKRRELDPSVADILRQEAELESKARERAGEGLESQPDLGLETRESDPDRRAREAQDRMARMRGEDPNAKPSPAEAAATAAAIGSRRDLLPDIEEINSTLRSTSDRQSGGTGAGAVSGGDTTPSRPVRRKAGFRRGFMLMIVLTLILGAIYVFAPQIAQSVPQANPYLSDYVAQVDMLRIWLDGRVTTLLTWLDTLASSQSQ